MYEGCKWWWHNLEIYGGHGRLPQDYDLQNNQNINQTFYMLKGQLHCNDESVKKNISRQFLYTFIFIVTHYGLLFVFHLLILILRWFLLHLDFYCILLLLLIFFIAYKVSVLHHIFLIFLYWVSIQTFCRAVLLFLLFLPKNNKTNKKHMNMTSWERPKGFSIF